MKLYRTKIKIKKYEPNNVELTFSTPMRYDDTKEYSIEHLLYINGRKDGGALLSLLFMVGDWLRARRGKNDPRVYLDEQ